MGILRLPHLRDCKSLGSGSPRRPSDKRFDARRANSLATSGRIVPLIAPAPTHTYVREFVHGRRKT